METFWSTLRLWQRVLHYLSERAFRNLIDLKCAAYNAAVIQTQAMDLGRRYLAACIKEASIREEVKAQENKLAAVAPCPVAGTHVHAHVYAYN